MERLVTAPLAAEMNVAQGPGEMATAPLLDPTMGNESRRRIQSSTILLKQLILEKGAARTFGR